MNKCHERKSPKECPLFKKGEVIRSSGKVADICEKCGLLVRRKFGGIFGEYEFKKKSKK